VGGRDPIKYLTISSVVFRKTMTILRQNRQCLDLLSKWPPVKYKLEDLPRGPACSQIANSYSMAVVFNSTGAVKGLVQSHRIQPESGI
jgi:hypothetical protein